MTKIVLGTASWGELDYGLAKEHPGMRMIRCILQLAKDNGITLVHWKDAYRDAYGVGDAVLELLDKFSMTKVTPPDYYGKKELRTALTSGPKSLSIIYNPLCQYQMGELHDYLGDVYVRSIFLQGILANVHLDPPSHHAAILRNRRDKLRARAREINLTSAQYCMAGAFNHPYVDYVILGLNTVDQLKAALAIEAKTPPVMFQPEQCLGESDATDPRTWEVLRHRQSPVEPPAVPHDDPPPPRRMAPQRQGKRK